LVGAAGAIRSLQKDGAMRKHAENQRDAGVQPSLQRDGGGAVPTLIEW